MGNDIDLDGDASPDQPGENPSGKLKKPKKGGFKATTERLRDGKDAHVSHRASLDWRHDQKRVCEKPGDEETPALEELFSILGKSRTAEMLIATAKDFGIQVFYDAQMPGSQYYMRGRDGAAGGIITLNPHRPRGELLHLLSRELRRGWQHKEGALVNPLGFEPDEAILINRAQQADTLMIAIKIAWELKLTGEQEVWNFIAGSPMADVSRTFELKVQTDFRTLNNGEAPRAAYDKFFEDSRTKLHDKRLIHQMLLDESNYIRNVGPRPRVSTDLFSKLGEMPQGKNYLMLRGKRGPADLCYSTVEDRSNANFLWFIKFERSFQEKEAEMLERSVKLSAEIVDFAKWSTRRSAEKPS